MPISVMLYGNIGIDGRAVSAFESGMVREAYSGPLYHFRFNDRLSYFSQLVVARKFTDWFSLQAAVSFTHYNAVGTLYDHDKVGVHASGRIKVSPQGSIIFNYDQPLKIKDISEQREWTNAPKPNLAFGYEVIYRNSCIPDLYGFYNFVIATRQYHVESKTKWIKPVSQ